MQHALLVTKHVNMPLVYTANSAATQERQLHTLIFHRTINRFNKGKLSKKERLLSRATQ
ncbi:hypothetical protein ACPOL_6913 (plasmid) [Acidisarcina polymorpha]|uniref:Uncharacterized protein n=1 Tax=Acidisarcina polymorpha TaxID=2211140 RepID=A0A2Z5GAG2_9BACT|nr:hypothetical protein ACPOL_6913 [Acidisarcina polymorpha]